MYQALVRGVPRSITWVRVKPSLLALSRQVCAKMSTLETLRFDNRALRSLPVDKDEQNYERTVNGACYSRVDPTPVSNPRLVACSQSALDLLPLLPSETERAEFVEFFSGSKLLPGSQPASHCYCGHQFGYFSGQLGDGCAHSLGEVVNSDSGERWELQLKGSGKTPYSRHADGRKVLRSSIREFLCSEALHYLGIPTTRAGTCVTSDDLVSRDVNYDGRNIREKVTVISRIAPTFLRFGSFEVFKPRDGFTGRTGPSVGRTDMLHQLLDYTTENFFNEIHVAHADDREARTADFFSEVCRRTGRLVALWQCVGFCHSVLNTDNMSIIGVTLDYGPFGFLDRYDPGRVFNTTDTKGRYAYGRQPEICAWNLRKLAEALSPLLSPEKAEEGLKIYDTEFGDVYLNKMRAKLGLAQKQLPDDRSLAFSCHDVFFPSDLIESFLDTLLRTGCDFTNGFRCLLHLESTCNEANSDNLEDVVQCFLNECATPQELIATFKPLLSPHHLQMFSALIAESPAALQALDLTVETISSEIEKHKNIARLKEMTPENKRAEDKQLWLAWLKTYRVRLLKEFEGSDTAQLRKEHFKALELNNPRFVLRTHILQKAIELAEKEDFSEVHRLLKLLESPYSSDTPSDALQNTHQPSLTDNQATNSAPILQHYFGRPPQWAMGLALS